MLSTNNTRKQITDLSEPIQIRELNRQLDWIWKTLLGGIDLKNLSAAGVKEMTVLIESTMSEDITSLSDRVTVLEGLINDSEQTT